MQHAPLPPADLLPSQAFKHITATLKVAVLAWQEADAKLRLANLRSTYASDSYAIAQYLVLPSPGWSPSAAPDNWQSGRHGELARDVIDTTEARRSKPGAE